MKKMLLGFAATVLAANVNAAATATTSAVAPVDTASTISAPVAAVVPAKKKVTMSYVAENSVGAREANTRNWSGAVESQQHVGLAYDLGDDKKVQYRQYFYYNMTDSTQKDETVLGDHVVQYSDATAAKIGEADMLFAARMYAPGTSNNKEVGKYELRLLQSAKQQVTGKLSLEYALNTRLYAYTNNDDGQRSLRILPAVSVEYSLNDTFTPYVGAFTDHSWFKNGSGLVLFGGAPGAMSNPSSNVDRLYTDIGTQISVVKGIDLNIYVETMKDLRSSAGYNPFDEANNSYNLEFSASL